MRLMVSLDSEVFERLQELALLERRDLRDQAAVLIAQELRRINSSRVKAQKQTETADKGQHIKPRKRRA